MTTVRYLDKPDRYPFYSVTNGASGDPVLDLDVDLEDHTGAVFLSREHGLSVGSALGMITKEAAKLMADEIKTLQDELAFLKGRENELRDRITDVFSDYLNPDADFVDPVAEGEDEENSGGSGEPVAEGDSIGDNRDDGDSGSAPVGKPEGKAGLAKSSNGKRSNSVSADASGVDDPLDLI